MSSMATQSDFDKQTGLDGNMKEKSLKGSLLNKEDGKHTHAPTLKASYQKNGKPPSHTDNSMAKHNRGDTASMVSFTTNHNSVVCLPLVSEGLKLVWTLSDQTRDLDTVPELVQMFNVFPYPTSRELSTLACLCALPLDKVKVWFMVQRIKYGISWTSEEIEETRHKLAGPERTTKSARNDEYKLDIKEIEEGSTAQPSPQKPPAKKPKYDSPECPNPPSVPKFSSSLPPPQDSYYYRQPADIPAATTASQDILEATPDNLQAQHRQGRYKKSKAQLALLRSSFLQENWPNEVELRRLQEETGLSRNDIRKWFSDSRYQLRNGRQSTGSVVTSPQKCQGDPQLPTSTESQQLQPLSLVAHKSRNQTKKVESKTLTRGKPVRNGARESDFFKNFLSNRLEAFGESAAVKEETSNSTDESSPLVPKEEPIELKTEGSPGDSEQPLKFEPENPVALLPTKTLSPSPSATPPPASAALPHKRSSTGSLTTHKTVTKANPSATTSSLSSSSPQLTAAGRPRKTKEQLDVLKQHFLSSQWPSSEDYTKLVELTGLPRADVIQWFGDTRYAVKHGQLRWVGDIREQIVADITQQQNGGAGVNTGGGGPRASGSRKRKSQGGGATKGSTTAPIDSPDLRPLENYYQQTGALQEKFLDMLCRKSRMSYQQVRDWFASQEAESKPFESSI